MVVLQRTAPPNPRKRHASASDAQPQTPSAAFSATDAFAGAKLNAKASVGGARSEGTDDGERHISTLLSVLADAGCTLLGPHSSTPSVPSDPHLLRCHLEGRLSANPSLRCDFLSGFCAYIRTPQNLKRILIPASQYGFAPKGQSLVRILLLVAPIQSRIQQLLLEKLPEYFGVPGDDSLPLKDDVPRLIVNQFRWLDFVVDADGFIEKLMEVLSISPPQLKKEIVGSLPEIIGDQSNVTLVAALDRLLQEDSELIVPVLDSFSALNLDVQLQEQVLVLTLPFLYYIVLLLLSSSISLQACGGTKFGTLFIGFLKAVTSALSCIRTVEAEYMPHLLRFLLLSATPVNITRIISQIRQQLKFASVTNSHASRNKKLKGKTTTESTDASILDALRLSLLFKNVL